MLRLTDMNAQVARLEEMQKSVSASYNSDINVKVAIEQALATAYVAQELRYSSANEVLNNGHVLQACNEFTPTQLQVFVIVLVNSLRYRSV
jgi:hypothetical protein